MGLVVDVTAAIPWIRINADIVDNEKMLGLSSDAARWAALTVLCRAKLRRPQGQFGSRAVLDHLLGSHAQHVDELVQAGILEVAPSICKRCRVHVGGRIRSGIIVVHDFGFHQPSSAERVAEWRAANGDLNGHQRKSERGGNGFPDVSPGDTRDASPSLPSRALSPSPVEDLRDDEVRPLVQGVRGPGEGGDELDIAEAWLASRHAGVAAGAKSHIKLAQLVDTHGAAAVIEAMEAVPGPNHEGAQYIYGAVRILRPIRSIPRSDHAPDPDGAERNKRAVEATKRQRAELEAIKPPDGPFEMLLSPSVLGGNS